jgi:hypothetical protein
MVKELASKQQRRRLENSYEPYNSRKIKGREMREGKAYVCGSG